MAAEIRDQFGLGSWWRISSAIEFDDDQLKLNISLDGKNEHKMIVITTKSSQIDEMFASAAESIFGVIDPYVVAATYLRKDQRKSIQLAGQIIASYPASDSIVAWAHVLKSVIRYNWQDYSGSVREAREAIKLNSRIPAAHINLALALLVQGNVEEAFEEYREAIWLNDYDAIAYNDLGNLLYGHGELRLAIDQVNKSIELDPNYSPAHNSLGAVLWNQGEEERNRGEKNASQEFSNATQEFRRAVASDPEDAMAHANLAVALAAQNELHSAIEEFEKAIKLNPNDSNARHQLLAALRRQAEINEEIKEFGAVIAIDPE